MTTEEHIEPPLYEYSFGDLIHDYINCKELSDKYPDLQNSADMAAELLENIRIKAMLLLLGLYLNLDKED